MNERVPDSSGFAGHGDGAVVSRRCLPAARLAGTGFVAELRVSDFHHDHHHSAAPTSTSVDPRPGTGARPSISGWKAPPQRPIGKAGRFHGHRRWESIVATSRRYLCPTEVEGERAAADAVGRTLGLPTAELFSRRVIVVVTG